MARSGPFFSVVVPLYDKGPFISMTLESVLAQTFENFEVIVVDDGSNDNGPANVVAVGDARVHLIRQDNGGVALARNRGIDEADGTWIAFLDGDDLWAPDHLNELRALIDKFPDARMIGTGFRKIASASSSLNSAGGSELRRANFLREIGDGAPPFFTSSLAIERAVLEEAGGFKPLHIGEDRELFARIALAHPVAASSRITVGYRQETGGIMDQSKRRWRVEALHAAADIAPAVDTVLKARESAADVQVREDIDRFVDRYVGFVVSSSVVHNDVELLRKAGTLFRRSPTVKQRRYLMIASLPRWLACLMLKLRGFAAMGSRRLR